MKSCDLLIGAFSSFQFSKEYFIRSSSQHAGFAFAVATAGSANPKDLQPGDATFGDCAKRKMSISSSAATMRVLSVMRHWITKHNQVSNQEVNTIHKCRSSVIFMEDHIPIRSDRSLLLGRQTSLDF